MLEVVHDDDVIPLVTVTMSVVDAIGDTATVFLHHDANTIEPTAMMLASYSTVSGDSPER